MHLGPIVCHWGTTLAALRFPGTLRTILFDVSGSSISKKETTAGEAAERNGEPGSRSQRLFSLVPSPVISTMWVREQSVTRFKKCWVRLGGCVRSIYLCWRKACKREIQSVYLKMSNISSSMDQLGRTAFEATLIFCTFQPPH